MSEIFHRTALTEEPPNAMPEERKRSNSFPEVMGMTSAKENAKSAGEKSYSMTGRDLDSHKGSEDNDYKRAFGHEGSIIKNKASKLVKSSF
ncbi:predicted protein [Arabidopsis lyrata subsp. lyrata]|uniref:Predicted protein n=1 Tax=Arabidopsis lyrata subsp. lyrata TaxID=81972 RepID=D7KWZ6_ARALL|nr:predicted protein [Arabidopsis lyrata subsp. lyrata]